MNGDNASIVESEDEGISADDSQKDTPLSTANGDSSHPDTR